MGGVCSRAGARPPNKLKRFLTIATIAEMGGSRTGPTKEQTGASRQRSSREREPADEGAEPRDPRVATIQGWIWGPLSKGGHYPRVDHGSTIQGWPLSKCGSGVHYPRVATSGNCCQKPFLGALSKGELALFKLISIRSILSKHLYRILMQIWSAEPRAFLY